MKKIYAVVATALIATAIFFVQKKDSECLFDANVEALTQSELPGAQIMCNSGNCGRCFEERTAWPVISARGRDLRKITVIVIS